MLKTMAVSVDVFQLIQCKYTYVNIYWINMNIQIYNTRNMNIPTWTRNSSLSTFNWCSMFMKQVCWKTTTSWQGNWACSSELLRERACIFSAMKAVQRSTIIRQGSPYQLRQLVCIHMTCSDWDELRSRSLERQRVLWCCILRAA